MGVLLLLLCVCAYRRRDVVRHRYLVNLHEKLEQELDVKHLLERQDQNCMTCKSRLDLFLSTIRTLFL